MFYTKKKLVSCKTYTYTIVKINYQVNNSNKLKRGCTPISNKNYFFYYRHKYNNVMQEEYQRRVNVYLKLIIVNDSCMICLIS